MNRFNGGAGRGYSPGPSAMPTRFRCKVGGEWKPLDAFSSNQRKSVQMRFDKGQRVDPAHSGMACREHTSQVAATIKCDLCGLDKDRSQFSKSSLKNDDFKCVNCVAWIETQEPDVTPAPLLTGHVSAEEESREALAERVRNNEDVVGSISLPQAPISSLASLGIEEEEEQEIPPGLDVSDLIQEALTSTSGTRGTGLSSRVIPVSQRQAQWRSASDTTSLEDDLDSLDIRSVATSSRTSGQPRGASSLPPHLRGRGESQTSSTENARPYGAAESTLTATTMRTSRHVAQHTTYNAWDASGVRHDRTKTASTTSSSLIDYGQDEESTDTDTTAFSAVQPKRGKHKWHKAPRLSMAELRAFEDCESSARHINPNVDHQRRYNNPDAKKL